MFIFLFLYNSTLTDILIHSDFDVKLWCSGNTCLIFIYQDLDIDLVHKLKKVRSFYFNRNLSRKLNA